MTGLGAPFALAGTAPDRKWQRVTGAVLVVLLHLLGLLAALHAISRPGAGRHLEHELTFVLAPLLKPSPVIRARPVPAAMPPRSISLPPTLFPPSITAPPSTPDVRTLGQSLFGCAPENLANLSPEQRARCGTGIAPSSDMAVTEPRSHVKDPQLRAAEMEKKNTPMTVPCVTIETQALGNSAEQQILMVDPLCAARETSR